MGVAAYALQTGSGRQVREICGGQPRGGCTYRRRALRQAVAASVSVSGQSCDCGVGGRASERHAAVETESENGVV